MPDGFISLEYELPLCDGWYELYAMLFGEGGMRRGVERRYGLMTPMEAWAVISANLLDYYKKQRTPTFKGYVDADVEAEVICFKALREMELKERSKK